MTTSKRSTSPRMCVEQGVHAGAEVRLSEISVVGSDASCDLILRDEGVLPLHAILQFTPSGLTARPAPGGEIDVDGVMHSAGCVALHDGSMLRIKGATLRFHETGQPSRAPTASIQRPAAPKPAWSLGKFALMGGSLAVGAAAILFAVEQLHPVAVAKPSRAPPMGIADTMQQRLRHLGLNDLKVVPGVRGNVQIRGFVADPGQAQLVNDDPVLQRFKPWQARFATGSTMAAALNQIINVEDVHATYESGGKLRLNGVVNDAGQIKKLDRIVKEVGMDIEIVNTVTYQVVKAGIEADAAKQPSSSKFKVSAVVIGNPAFVETMDGRRYFKGSKLTDGSVITAIDQGSITLQRGDVKSVVEVPPALDGETRTTALR